MKTIFDEIENIPAVVALGYGGHGTEEPDTKETITNHFETFGLNNLNEETFYGIDLIPKPNKATGLVHLEGKFRMNLRRFPDESIKLVHSVLSFGYYSLLSKDHDETEVDYNNSLSRIIANKMSPNGSFLLGMENKQFAQVEPSLVQSGFKLKEAREFSDSDYNLTVYAKIFKQQKKQMSHYLLEKK